MKFSKALEIPKVWQKLLDLDFGSRRGGVEHARIGTKIADPKPYRDDERIVSIAEGGYVVHLFLCSGRNNYWLDYGVWLGKELIYESDALFDVPKKKDVITLRNGDVLEFKIKLI